MRVSYHPDAEAEVIEAALFYSRKAADLGADFLDQIDQAVEDVLRDPTRFEVIEDDIRRCPVKRFPYSLYFRVRDKTVRILVVKHHSRHPDYWKPRE